MVVKDDDLVAAISTGDAGRVNSLLPSALEVWVRG